MGRAEAAFEIETKRVLGVLLGGSAVDRDVGPAQGVRDFDLVDSDGAVRHSVEVTSVQMPAARATRSGLERLQERTDLGLTESWSITVHEKAPVQPIAREAAPLLNQLQGRGITRFNHLKPPADLVAANAVGKLAALHIPHGFAMPTADPPRLFPGGYGSGSLDPGNLTEAVNAEAAKSDNRAKLAASPKNALRHLFVWLHDSDWYVSVLLRALIETPPPPSLPPEIDVLWAAVGDGPTGLTCSGLLRSDGAGWMTVPPPA